MIINFQINRLPDTDLQNIYYYNSSVSIQKIERLMGHPTLDGTKYSRRLQSSLQRSYNDQSIFCGNHKIKLPYEYADN